MTREALLTESAKIGNRIVRSIRAGLQSRPAISLEGGVSEPLSFLLRRIGDLCLRSPRRLILRPFALPHVYD
jgi:hypothetical protein